MNKVYVSILSAIVIALASGCSKGNDTADKPTLAVSIEPLRNITEQIAGDDFDVETVLDRGANPETFDPSINRRATVDKSLAFFTTGSFPFEEKLASSANKTVDVADISTGINRVYGTHSHSHGNGPECHHNHNDADPHTWTSAKNAVIIAENIARKLSELNPEHAEVYEHRKDSLVREIESLDNRITTQLSDVPSRSFAIWHPSLSYFARDYNLKQIAVGQENKEVSPRRLKEILDQTEAEGIRVFFFQKEFDSRQAMTINDHIGSRMVVIDPLDYDWMKQLQLIADELSR